MSNSMSRKDFLKNAATGTAGMGILSAFGATTAIAGPIAFVGLMVPHLVNLLYKGNLRMQMLLTALLGAFVLTAADVLGRVAVSPGELEVGILTAFVGAPVFIAVAVRSAGAMRTGEVA